MATRTKLEDIEDPAEKARAILANCKPKDVPGFEGCLIWQGAIDDRGYGYVKLNGKRTKIQTIVKLYGQGYSAKQIGSLKQTCRLVCECPKGLKTCMTHWTFKTKNDPTYFESSDLLRGELESAGYL